MSRSLKLGVAAVVILVLVGGVLAVRRGGAVVLDAPAIALDLARPDALVETASLADLPRDLLTVPMFRDLLTEDFVAYYEQTEGRLSLGGTLRRLAYEHDLDLGDWIVRTVIDQPAEIALWKAGDGRLGHALVAVNRSGLTRVLEMAAKVALKDAQLKRVDGDLDVDGAAVPVYALAYARGRVLLFAGHGDRLVILSDAAMLADRRGRLRGAGRTVVVGLLSTRAEPRRIYRDHFALEPGDRRRDDGDAAGRGRARRSRCRLLVPNVAALHAAVPGADAAAAGAGRGGGPRAAVHRGDRGRGVAHARRHAGLAPPPAVLGGD